MYVYWQKGNNGHIIADTSKTTEMSCAI